MHAPVSSSFEYVPAPQAVHFESIVGLPGVYPNPGEHLLLLWAWHDALPVVRNVPVAHAPGHAASDVVVPGIILSPALHVGAECARHADLSVEAEYVFARHSEQDASADDDPAA